MNSNLSHDAEEHRFIDQPSSLRIIYMKDADCVDFLQWALPQLELSWRGFRKVRRQVCRRLKKRMSILGLTDFDDYRDMLESNPEEWSSLDDCCHITISRFYRDKRVFETLEKLVLPEIAKAATPYRATLSCWSIGCASGEEVYTLKILWDLVLAQQFPNIGLAILGTDIDETVLGRATEGCYDPGTLKDLPREWLEKGFETDGRHFCVEQRHRFLVSFKCQDIRREVAAGPFELIFCRNTVFTYFELALQLRVFSSILKQLKSGGYLVIGAHELLPGNTAQYFDPVINCPQILRLRQHQ